VAVFGEAGQVQAVVLEHPAVLQQQVRQALFAVF
jgi:hypothetical protein